MSCDNASIVAAARGWLGTRFHHQGRLKKTEMHKGGVDCLGLLIGIAKELELCHSDGTPIIAFDKQDYPHYPDVVLLRSQLERILSPVTTREITPGHIVLLNIDGNPQHLAIVADREGGHSIIHAYAPAHKVVEHPLDSWCGGNNLLNLERQYKPVTFGSTLAASAAQDFTYTGIALKPYAPVHICGARDGSDNLTINWVRRTRISGEWQDGVDVPLSEAAEAYEVDILDGGDVVRTITGINSPSTAYSAADQITDFGSPQSSVSVRVYQLSEVIGRGYAGEGDI